MLSSVLGTHKFIVPVTQLERGQAYVGSSVRLRHVLRQLLFGGGSSVRVGVIGGSISWGQGADQRGTNDWFSIVAKWMIAAFPHAEVKARNGCVPGTRSAYTILCLEQSVDLDVDLLFIEFTLNEGFEGRLEHNPTVMDMERLVRRALDLPHKPAVVLMHMPTHGIASYPQGHPKVSKDDVYRPFWETTEDAQGVVAQYYDVQALSLRTTLYDLAVGRPREGFLWEQVFADHHPGISGHAMTADLAIYLLQQTAIKLLFRPYGREDEEARAAPLPAPIYEGNMPPASPMCTMYDALRNLTTLTEGWEYVTEGTPQKPKPGFVATQPGSRLRLKINTDRSFDKDVSVEERVHVFFHHLRSYEHMGVASFNCVAGCTCSEAVVDAHHADKESQLFIVRLEVSQSAQCEVEIKVLEQTSSGEHKFKIAGFVISERAGGGGCMDHMHGSDEVARFGVAVHNGDQRQVTMDRNGTEVDVRARA